MGSNTADVFDAAADNVEDILRSHHLNDDDHTMNISCSFNGTSPCESNVSPEEAIIYITLYSIVAPTLFAAFTIVGIVGNSLVAYVILSNPRMRNVTNLLLLNLAVADIACLLFCGPFSAYKYAVYEWTFGTVACQLVQYVLYVTVYVTIYTLVAISAYRYVTIVHGLKSQANRNHLLTVCLILALWLITMTLNVPTLLAHRVKQFVAPEWPASPPYVYCGIEPSSISAIFISFFVFGYAVPLLIIGTLYILIVRYLRSRKSASTLAESSQKRNSRTCRVIAIVVIVFGISWLPHHINAMLALNRSIPKGLFYEVLRVIFQCMSFGNSCVNPFIYNYGSKEFQTSFRRAFTRRRPGRADSNTSPAWTSPPEQINDAPLEIV